jgi:uncharacterized protein (DUF924 family)
MPTPSALDEQVLAFWFGAPGDAWFGRFRPEWFQKNAAFDQAIRRRFSSLLEALTEGEHQDWLLSPRGALAFVIVLDQFSRNLFRDDARAFVQDALARSAADQAIRRGFDAETPPVERGFFYLPFMHSEDLGDQARSVALYEALAEGDAGNSSLDYARRHRDIIARFGRFPHRNAALGRPSTPEEVAFLSQPGSGF